MEQQEERDFATELAGAVEVGDAAALERVVASVPSPEIAQAIKKLSLHQKGRLLRLLPDERSAEILSALEPKEGAQLLRDFTRGEIADILDKMPPDDAADVVGELGQAQAQDVLVEMEEADDVRELIQYPPDSAGGIMTPEYVAVRPDLTVQEALQALRSIADQAETIYYVYVTDEQDRLLGVLSLRELVLAKSGTLISNIMIKEPVRVKVADDQEKAALLIRDYNLLAIPVVDKENRLEGIITVDDVTDILQQEVAEDFQKAVGVGSGDETVLTPALQAVRGRLPWVVASLFFSLMGASAVSIFRDTISSVVVLAVLMPIIANAGGQAGIQSLSVAIRSLALGEIGLGQFWRGSLKELRIGILHGLVMGVVFAMIALAVSRRPGVALVAAVSMWINIMIASVLGGTMPFLLKMLNRDPAIMTGPLLTTITDFTGFFLFLGMSTLLFPYL